MTQVKCIKKGDQFYCTHKRVPSVMLCTVIALTDEPGKLIGVEFEECVNGHSCDNRGVEGNCLWVSPYDLLNEEEYEANNKVKEAVSKYKELDTLQL
jgi:hypothetical protein